MNAYYIDICIAEEPVINQIPLSPSIFGPNNGMVNVSYEFYIISTDPDNDDVYYFINWDDGTTGTWIGPYPSSVVVNISHLWNISGIYNITAKAKDVNSLESDWSEPFTMTIIQNDPPSPPIITGQLSGKTGISYPYTFTSTDPENEDVSYFINWGDGNITNWTAYQTPGPPGYIESHSWDIEGTYVIQAKAKNSKGIESEWSLFPVIMPRDKSIFTLFLNWLQSHPNIFPLLQPLFHRFGLQ
jgi:hypothetical protein